MADKNTISRTAVYMCETRIGHMDFVPVKLKVSVKRIDGEDPKKTLERFRDAAKKLNGMMVGGCYRRTFSALVLTAAEKAARLMAAKAPEEAKPPRSSDGAEKKAPKVHPYDPCATSDFKRWPICYKK